MARIITVVEASIKDRAGNKSLDMTILSLQKIIKLSKMKVTDKFNFIHQAIPKAFQVATRHRRRRAAEHTN